jgi:hypothetical protein
MGLIAHPKFLRDVSLRGTMRYVGQPTSILLLIRLRTRPCESMHQRAQIKLNASDRAELEQSAKARVASEDRAVDFRWRWHRRDHAADRKGEDVRLALKERFGAAGVAELWREKTRPSRIPPLDPRTAERVLTLTLAGPPPHATRWTGAAMAMAIGISISSVQRIWRRRGLQLIACVCSNSKTKC